MTLPTPTKDYSATMNHVDWTENGSPTYSDDDWNAAAALDGDGVNNYLEQTEIITSADGDEHTVSCWLTTASEGTDEVIYAQGDVGVEEARIALYKAASGGVFAIWETGVGPTARLRSLSADMGLDDGDKHHIVCTVKGSTDTAAMYVDSVEVTYSTQDQVTGAGYSGVPVGIDSTTTGADQGGANLLQSGSTITRLKIWKSSFATAAEVLEEYEAELAAIPSGDQFDGVRPFIRPRIRPLIRSRILS